MLAEQLDGVGTARAAAIVKYRTENGEFPSVASLVNVSGIGEAKADVLREAGRTDFDDAGTRKVMVAHAKLRPA